MRVCSNTSSFMLRLWGGCACEKPHHQSTFIRTILLVAKEPSLWLLVFLGAGVWLLSRRLYTKNVCVNLK